MRYLAIAVLACFGIGVIIPPLLFAPHQLTLIPAIVGGLPLSFALFLASPERFVAWVTCLGSVRLTPFSRGDAPPRDPPIPPEQP